MLVRLALAIAALAGPVSAQDTNIEDGRDLFLYFCAECHGKDAASIGPMAEMLAVEPPDLTALTERNGGSFPTESVAMQIDGRIRLDGHGDMPVFGPPLESDQFVTLKLPNGQPMMIAQHLANLMTYLQSLQSKPDNTE
jgi:mono/diheme cytochrome c family protein